MINFEKTYEALKDFFFPPLCVRCGDFNENYLCDECRKMTDENFAPQKFVLRGGNGYIDEAFTLFKYRDGVILPILIDLKREGVSGTYDILMPYVIKGLKKSGFIEKSDFITFCPRTVFSLRKYGFDQSENMAKRISEESGIPFEKAIKRFPVSLSQHILPAKLRKLNTKFTFYTKKRFDGQNVLIFDDVVTTGSTAEAVAKLLKKHGAMKVFVFSLAH